MDPNDEEVGPLEMPPGVDPLWLAQTWLMQRKHERCLALCSELLAQDPDNKAACWIQMRALTQQNWAPPYEEDEQTLADQLLDDNAMAALPRPGTSLARPATAGTGGVGGVGSGAPSTTATTAANRPCTAANRPGTGIAAMRDLTSSNYPAGGGGGRSSAASAARLRTAGGRASTGFLRPGSATGRRASAGGRPGTRGGSGAGTATGGGGNPSLSPSGLLPGVVGGGGRRPGSSSGRHLSRAGSAAISAYAGSNGGGGVGSWGGSSSGGGISGGMGGVGTGAAAAAMMAMLDAERLDPAAAARDPAVARALTDYLLSGPGRNPRRALELCAAATAAAEYRDWWWKAALGRCHYALGLLRDAEAQLRSAAAAAPAVATTPLHLGKVYLRLDQPNKALEVYSAPLSRYTTLGGDPNNDDGGSSSVGGRSSNGAGGGSGSNSPGASRAAQMQPGHAQSSPPRARAGGGAISAAAAAAAAAMAGAGAGAGAGAHRPYGGACLLSAAAARVHGALGDRPAAAETYARAAAMDASHAESLASLAAWHYDQGKPTKAAALYERLLALGHSGSAEVWANLALCNFRADRLESCLWAFERALALAGDDALADVWFNAAHVALGVGDAGWAYQCLKLATAVDPGHGEALTCLGALEEARGGPGGGAGGGGGGQASAAANYREAQLCGSGGGTRGVPLLEPWFNGALLDWRRGDVQAAHHQVLRALEIAPDHAPSRWLLAQVHEQLSTLR